MSEVDGSMLTAALSIFGLIGKAAIDHWKIATLEKNDIKNKDRINALEDEKIKVTEALDRTFATREYVQEYFVTRRQHEENIRHIEEKLLARMDNIAGAVEMIYSVIGGRRKNDKE
jgi:hypothetical protein